MQTIQHAYNTEQAYNTGYIPVTRKHSLLKSFFTWCKEQEQYRLGWLASILAIHGCVLAPLTLFAIFMGGNSFVFWAMTISAFTMALVTNLAALPTKITIPIFFFSVLIDLVVIITSMVYAFQS